MRKTSKFVYVTKPGIEINLQFPTLKIVCPRCDGKGTHVNPNVDGNGITAEEWENDWDDESRENYLSGVYDVVCEVCAGNNVIDEVNEKALTKKQSRYLRLFNRQRMLRDQGDANDRRTMFYENGGRYE